MHLRHLSSDCAGLLARLNGDARPYEVIESDPATDPVYEVAAKSGLIAGVKVPEVVDSPPKDPEEWETKLEEAAKDDPLGVVSDGGGSSTVEWRSSRARDNV